MAISDLLILLISIPVLGSAIAQLLVNRLGKATVFISLGASVLTFATASFLLILSLSGLPDQSVASPHFWGVLLFDPLSTLMAFVIATISMLVHFYSRRYMLEEKGYSRFFILLGLMTAVLLLMVSAGDLISLLIAWHLIGILLYFLLGHDTGSQEAFRFSSWTLITYRIGDVPLLLAAVILFSAFDSWSLPYIFEQLNQNPDLTTIFGLPLAETAAMLVAISAFARSAQFLLHTWLPYTMSGPTPVSALMHAGIVNAGGILINRFAPVYLHTDWTLHVVFVVGLITAVIGSVLMLSQNDIKKELGYSTMGQMGFMIMECGVGAFSLAIYHLIAHGLFKGTLFLSAGSVINAARQHDGIPKDDLYTFVVERRPAMMKYPWIIMTAITVLIPVGILVFSHLMVASDYFQQQGAIILLFFGWVTGAQLIFSTYRMHSDNPWRLITFIIFSFTVVVIGYAFISHAFELFLFPDESIRHGIYAAASIDIFWFEVLVFLVAITITLSWLVTYYQEQHGKPVQILQSLKLKFYAMIAKEFFVIALYRNLHDALLRIATRLNVLLRWY